MAELGEMQGGKLICPTPPTCSWSRGRFMRAQYHIILPRTLTSVRQRIGAAFQALPEGIWLLMRNTPVIKTQDGHNS